MHRTSRTNTRHRARLALSGAGALAVATALIAANSPSAGAATAGDGAVTTDRSYVKANGRTPAPGDAIELCGTNRRQQNEPSTAVEPSNTGNIVAGSNDYCTVPGAGGTWTGFYHSTNGGKTWTDSLLPGYPTDSSPRARPVRCSSRGSATPVTRSRSGTSPGTCSTASGRAAAVVFVKSTDGGASFTKPQVATTFDSFDAADTVGTPTAAAKAHQDAFLKADGPGGEAGQESSGNSRDCGSGPFACTSGYTFFRHDSSVRVTADPSRDPKTVYAVFDATKPATEARSTSTYNSAPTAPDGTLQVGQGGIYLTKTTNGGITWSAPTLIDNESVGHQLFPDINADGGVLHALWHDSRNDTCYSVQNAIGDCTAKDISEFHTASTNGLDSYGAVSRNGGASWTTSRLSSMSQKPDYEMFGNRRVPFHGDYNYVSSVGAFAYNVWTDNRQVAPGDDPRYTGGEGFDVLQCRGATAPFTADTWPNAGGLDQDIFGAASSG